MIPSALRPKLADAAESVIQQVCTQRLGLMKRPPRIEVDFIASFVESGAPLIDAAWEGILGPCGVDVRVAGVFCHQSPKVNIQGPRPSGVLTQACELADLLILHSHQRPDGRVFWRGVLVQAKAHTGQKVAPDQPQFWLYESWPDFSITSRGFDPRWRDFNHNQRSGRYALISNAGCLILPPINPLDATSTDCMMLSNFLVGMLYDMDPHQPRRISKHGRQVYHDSKNEWSQTIWDLLDKTAKNALRHKGIIYGQYDRDISRFGGQVFVPVRASGVDDIPPADRPPEEDEDDGSGVSILLIETRTDRDFPEE